MQMVPAYYKPEIFFESFYFLLVLISPIRVSVSQRNYYSIFLSFLIYLILSNQSIFPNLWVVKIFFITVDLHPNQTIRGSLIQNEVQCRAIQIKLEVSSLEEKVPLFSSVPVFSELAPE